MPHQVASDLFSLTRRAADGHGLKRAGDSPTTEAAHRTIVVCGIERGGTSMLALTLHALGVSMGRELGATGEDFEILKTLHALSRADTLEHRAEWSTLVHARNEARAVWGFKVPNVFDLVDVLPSLRNPIVIAVFRDTLAISARRATSRRTDVRAMLKSSHRLQNRMMTFLLQTETPWFAFSYEKCLLNPTDFVNQLSKDLGLQSSSARRRRAAKIVKPSPVQYLQETVAPQIIGNVDGVSLGSVRGWALDVSDQFATVEASVFVDGKFQAKIKADVPRGDLADQTPDNICHGFDFLLPIDVVPGDHVLELKVEHAGNVRIEGDVRPFHMPAVHGCFDGLVGRSLCAWFWNREGRSEDLTAVVMIDGKRAGNAPVTHYRDDLETIGLPDVCGMSFGIPADLQDGHDHGVSIYLDGINDCEIEHQHQVVTFPRIEHRRSV